jgi:oxygen-independent coproporphyrinogen-3 oxidase
MDTFPLPTEELLARLDIPAPRYTSYPTVPAWREAFTSAHHAAALARAAASPDEPLSIYVHIPFCHRMCSYCGCNVVVARHVERADPYLDAIEREAEIAAGHLGARRTTSRLHLGGGTPTFLDEPRLERLWRALTRHFRIADGAELAIEVDPVVTSRGQIALLAGLGFRRLSLGVQDFDPAVQSAIGRHQTLHETRAVIEHARAVGFSSVNLDLIYGLPRQTPASWRRTLSDAISLSPDRTAVFSFAYVPDAKPHQRRLPVADIPHGRAKLALYAQAHDAFVAEGYVPIGMDHFARPDDELACAARAGRLWRDFQGYTTRVGETVALGPSAISEVGGAYAQNQHRLSAWQDALAAGRLATARGHLLDEDDRMRRALITHLMCNFEVDLGAAATRHAAALDPFEADHLLVRDGTRIRLTPLGRPFVRNVAMVFDAYLARSAAPPVHARAV